MKIGVAKTVRTGRMAAILAAMAMAGTVADAQTVPDSEVPTQAGLDLPANLQMFGKTDPNIRKPTALVNREVITGTDVDQRVALIIALNNFQINDQQRDQLKLSVLRSLIDETLQIQEAKANEIAISQDQISQSFSRVSQRMGRTPDQMRAWLREIGSSERSIKRQIEGELAWNRLLQRKVTINVGEEEVQAILIKLRESKGTEEYHVREIYLSATPERREAVFSAMQDMVQQMKQGAPFTYFARQSEATTRATEGDLGWVRSGVLPDALARAVEGMTPGQVAGPIEIPGGFSLIYLEDKRQVLTADPKDAKLTLRQITVPFPAGTTQAQASARAAEVAKLTQAMQGCGDVAKVAQQLGGEVVDNDGLRIRDLPPQLQDSMLSMNIGQATPPFGSAEEGVRVLVLCGRDEVSVAAEPSPDAIRNRIEEERTNLRAQRMLRDLRRDALVEYR